MRSPIRLEGGASCTNAEGGAMCMKDNSNQGTGKSTETFWYSVLPSTNLLRNFSLRAHKFSFQWDLVIYLFFCMASLLPFMVTGERAYAIIPLFIWLLYNTLFLIGTRRAGSRFHTHTI